MQHLSVLAFCVSSILFLNNAGIGQVVIRPGDIPMEPGTVFAYQVASDSGGIEVNVGESGANRHWDFTAFDIEIDSVVHDTLINPEHAPNVGDYAGTNRVLRTASGLFDIYAQDVYQYEKVSDDGWQLIGLAVVDQDQNFNIPLNLVENPVMIMPMPGEIDAEWNISMSYRYAIAPDTSWGEELALLDSIVVMLEAGGFAEIDAWGTAIYSEGEVNVIRQHARTGGTFNVIGVTYLFNQRIEIPVYSYELEASHVYRWYSPGVGVIAEITSLPLEDNPDFETARQVRLRVGLQQNVSETGSQPVEFTLLQNYPNPFNGGTNLRFSLSKSEYVILDIVDTYGRALNRVVDGYISAGHSEIPIKLPYSSGQYWARMTVNGEIFNSKMTLIK